MLHASLGEPRDDLVRSAGHEVADGAGGDFQLRHCRTEHHHLLLSVGPATEGQYGLKGLATDDNCIDGGDEFVVAVRLGVDWQPVERTVKTGYETVEAGCDKDGCLHILTRSFGSLGEDFLGGDEAGAEGQVEERDFGGDGY